MPVAAIDLGGTRLAVAAMAEDGEVLRERLESTPGYRGTLRDRAPGEITTRDVFAACDADLCGAARLALGSREP